MKKTEEIKCEDCGDEMEKGQRRFRCKRCNKLVCGWCLNHVHNEEMQSSLYPDAKLKD